MTNPILNKGYMPFLFLYAYYIIGIYLEYRGVYMRHSVYIKEIMGDIGILTFLEGKDHIKMPLKYLPKGSREGDILKMELSFDPFKTLQWSEKSI